MIRKIFIPNLSALPRKTKKKIKNDLERMLKKEVINQLKDIELQELSEDGTEPENIFVAETTKEPVSLREDNYVTRDEFNKIAAQRDEFINDLKRLQAEFDNYRKRMIKERAEMKDFLIQDVISRLLEVVGNLEHALNSNSEGTDIESYRTGVRMVYQQFLSILAEFGLTKIDTVGQPFDPRFHESVSQIENNEVKPGTITMEFTPGYKLKERLIRAPKVQIAVASKSD